MAVYRIDSDGSVHRIITDAGKPNGVAVRAASRPGIYVYSPEGKELDCVPTPDLPTNVGFGRGEESKMLYITVGGNLHRIRTNKEGYQLPTK